MSSLFEQPSKDSRLEGSAIFSATANTTSTHYMTFDFGCDFNGVEIYAWSSNVGDTLSLESQYNADPYGWKRYKKFGKGWNIFPNHVNRILLFPTKPGAGVRIEVKYKNTGNTAVDFAINKFQFVNMATIDTASLEEGEDW